MARVYVGGLRLPVEEDKIVALLERARGVEKVRDVEVHKGGNPIEQDCFMFAVIEPEEAADACVKAYNKCRWRKLTLKVERTKRGPFTLDMLKTPAGFDAPRKRKRPEAEIRPTLSSKPLRLRRCEGKREMVQVLPNKSNHFGNLSDDESSDDDDDDDDDDNSDKRKNGTDTWTVDFSEIKQPERVAPASDKPPPPLAAERAAAVRARLEAFENGTQHLSSADSDDGETQRALDNENTQLLGVLSSLLQEQQQASQSGNTEEEEFAAAYGIRKERTDGNSAGADHGGGIVQFMDDDDDNEKGRAADEDSEKTSDKMSDSDQVDDADEGVVDDEDNEEEENAEDDEEEDDEEDEEEEEEKDENDDEMKDAIVGNANENGAPEEAPKTQLRGIFEEFLSNKEQASSFSLFGSTFAGNAGADAEDSAETKDQDALDSLSNANSTFAPAEIVPASHTFHVADIFAAVDRVAAKRWQKDPADLFRRREGYEEEWLETQGEISRIFKSKAKLAKRHGFGRA